MTRFSLALEPVGVGRVVIDDTDVTDRVTAVEVAAQQGQPTRVVLWGHGLGDIAGTGTVDVADPNAAANLVRDLNSEQIRSAALATPGVGAGVSVIDATIEAVAAALETAEQ